MAAVDLLDTDRQRIRSEVGPDGLKDAPAEDSMCRRTTQDAKTLVVPATTADERFCDNGFVTGDAGIRSGAGAPLRAPDGERACPLGSWSTGGLPRLGAGSSRRRHRGRPAPLRGLGPGSRIRAQVARVRTGAKPTEA